MLGLFKLLLIASLTAAYTIEHGDWKHHSNHWSNSADPSSFKAVLSGSSSTLTPCINETSYIGTSSSSSSSESDLTLTRTLYNTSTLKSKSPISKSIAPSSANVTTTTEAVSGPVKTSEVDSTFTTDVTITSTIYSITTAVSSGTTLTTTEPCSTVVFEYSTVLTQVPTHKTIVSEVPTETSEVASTITSVFWSTFTVFPTTVVSGSSFTISESYSTFIEEVTSTFVPHSPSVEGTTKAAHHSTEEVTETTGDGKFSNTIEVSSHTRFPTVQVPTFSGFHNTTAAPTGFHNQTSTMGFQNSTALQPGVTITRPHTITHIVTDCETKGYTSLETLTSVEGGSEVISVVTRTLSSVASTIYPSVETTIETNICTKSVCHEASRTTGIATHNDSITAGTETPVEFTSVGTTAAESHEVTSIETALESSAHPTELSFVSTTSQIDEVTYLADLTSRAIGPRGAEYTSEGQSPSSAAKTAQELSTSTLALQEIGGSAAVVGAQGPSTFAPGHNSTVLPSGVSTFEGIAALPCIPTGLSFLAAIFFFL